MSIFRGFNSIWAAGDQISADEVTQAWLDMTGLKIVGVPLIVVIAIVILCAGYVLLYRTAIGRELFATGSNPDGARLIGIPVDRRILWPSAWPACSAACAARSGHPATPPSMPASRLASN